MKKVVRKTTEKYLTEKKFGVFEKTFEQSMRGVAKSFTKVDEFLEKINKSLERHDRALEIIIKELQAIHEDNKHFRQSISGLNSDGISYERKIEDLTIRVEKLEAKM